MTPEEYLRGKNLKLRKAPGEWQTQCQFCDDTNKYGHLYVNRDEGLWKCHRCGEAGNFAQLQERLGDKPSPEAVETAERWRVWGAALTVAQDNLVDSPDVIQYLRNERGLTPDTIGKYRIGYVLDGLVPALKRRFSDNDLNDAGLLTEEGMPLFYNRIIIPYLNGDNIVALRGKRVGENIVQARGTTIRLFGSDNLKGAKEVYICEGEFDAMYLDQLGFKTCAIPGALSYQEHWNHWFDDARRIFVLLDSDDAGRKGAERIKEFLGSRVHIVELPVPNDEKSTDVSEFFLRDGHSVEEFINLVKTYLTTRLALLDQGYKEYETLQAQSGVELGWLDLDMAIRPGLLPGQIVVPLAKTGVGKTAWATQVIHHMSGFTTHDGSVKGSDTPVLLLSLEQTRAEIANRLVRIARLYNPWAATEEILSWHSNFRMNDENRIPPEDLPLLINEFIDDVGVPPKVLVIDYLGYWARAFKATSKYEQVSDAIMEVKRLAKENGIVVISPHQVSRMSKRGQRIELDFARDSGVVEETADFAFGLRSINERTQEEEDGPRNWQTRADIRLEILKSRHGNVGKEVTMFWAPYSLSLVPRGLDSSIERRIEKEYSMLDMAYSYEQALEVLKGKGWNLPGRQQLGA